nr:MAG TPA: hypothetical protein [Caudoviricetes sp.]
MQENRSPPLRFSCAKIKKRGGASRNVSSPKTPQK